MRLLAIGGRTSSACKVAAAAYAVMYKEAYRCPDSEEAEEAAASLMALMMAARSSIPG